MRSLATRYNGYHFRSRLEARWAVFFDTCGLPYHYEPEGYDLSQVACPRHGNALGTADACVCPEREAIRSAPRYLPDFFLPTLRLRDQQPGMFFEVKGQHDRRADAKAHLLGHLTHLPVVIAERAPTPLWEQGLSQHYPWWDDFMVFMRCVRCQTTKIDYTENNYMVCPSCKAAASIEHPTLLAAMSTARGMRFERTQ